MYSASGLRVQYLQIVERKQGSAYKVGAQCVFLWWGVNGCPH